MTGYKLETEVSCPFCGGFNIAYDPSMDGSGDPGCLCLGGDTTYCGCALHCDAGDTPEDVKEKWETRADVPTVVQDVALCEYAGGIADEMVQHVKAVPEVTLREPTEPEPAKGPPRCIPCRGTGHIADFAYPDGSGMETSPCETCGGTGLEPGPKSEQTAHDAEWEEWERLALEDDEAAKPPKVDSLDRHKAMMENAPWLVGPFRDEPAATVKSGTQMQLEKARDRLMRGDDPKLVLQFTLEALIDAEQARLKKELSR